MTLEHTMSCDDVCRHPFHLKLQRQMFGHAELSASERRDKVHRLTELQEVIGPEVQQRRSPNKITPVGADKRKGSCITQRLEIREQIELTFDGHFRLPPALLKDPERSPSVEADVTKQSHQDVDIGCCGHV